MIAAADAGTVLGLIGLIVAIGLAIDARRQYKKQAGFNTQAESAAAAKTYAEEGEDPPNVYVHASHNPDRVKVFYEIPEVLADLVIAHDPTRTFDECLADLVDPEGRRP